MKRILSMILSLSLLGCGATGAPFIAVNEPTGDGANLYIYRPELAINCCVAPYILINNDKRGQLKNGGYVAFTVSPGQTTVEAVNETVGFKSLKLTFDVQTGKSYFLRWSAAASMGFGSNNEKKDISSASAEIFSSDETKKRAKEASEGKLTEIKRAIDFKTVNSDKPQLFVIAHERELRVIEQTEALKEITKTRKSD